MVDLGIILQGLRKQYKLTQADVARKMNVSVGTVARWEGNAAIPSAERLIQLSILYNVPLNYLVGIDTEKSIAIDKLTKRQQNVIYDLVAEFQRKKGVEKSLTAKQHEILGVLLEEFQNRGD